MELNEMTLGSMKDFEVKVMNLMVETLDLDLKTAFLVVDFATAMAKKLAQAKEKYGYTDEWANTEWMSECRRQLKIHIKKGDPVDVAAYCAFLWFHEEPTYVKKPDLEVLQEPVNPNQLELVLEERDEV